MQAELTPKILIDSLRETIEKMPTGGNERERQAWRNGAYEMASQLNDDLFGGDSKTEIAIATMTRGRVNE